MHVSHGHILATYRRRPAKTGCRYLLGVKWFKRISSRAGWVFPGGRHTCQTTTVLTTTVTTVGPSTKSPTSRNARIVPGQAFRLVLAVWGSGVRGRSRETWLGPRRGRSAGHQLPTRLCRRRCAVRIPQTGRQQSVTARWWWPPYTERSPTGAVPTNTAGRRTAGKCDPTLPNRKESKRDILTRCCQARCSVR